MILGFTGTRDIVTGAQLRWLYGFLDDSVSEGEIEAVHHGACVGADFEMHTACLERGIAVVVHPPIKTAFLAVECIKQGLSGVTVLPAEPYLNRDRAIVGASSALVALPSKVESAGGGTWYTVNYAARLGKPAVIVHPSGEVERRIFNQHRGI
jgi:predicted Rossmann fold nucleotide-binding protein DprA/Smf involved in DNA uptake